MHADKASHSNTVTHIPPAHNTLAARLQGKQATHKTGDLSPLLGRQWARPSGVQASGLQAKGQGNPAAAFSGSGHSIPSQQKYSQLLGKDLSNVRLHTGPQVDAVLQNNGLQGLTDGSGHIAVASTAESGTLEHEIVHIGQPPVTESNRAALETHADTQARNIMSGKAVEAFGGGNLQGKQSGDLQEKCKDCESAKKALQHKHQGLFQKKEDSAKAKPSGGERTEKLRDDSTRAGHLSLWSNPVFAGAHHYFVLLTGPDNEAPMHYRGGPEGSLPGAWGNIVAIAAPYEEGQKDWTTNPTSRIRLDLVGDWNTYNTYNSSLSGTMSAINSARIPYKLPRPTGGCGNGANSNSTAFQAVRNLGFNPSPTVLAPCWEVNPFDHAGGGAKAKVLEEPGLKPELEPGLKPKFA